VIFRSSQFWVLGFELILFLPQSPSPDMSLLWSANRRLAWNDYQAKPPARHDVSALTSYALSFDNDCDGGTYHVRIVAAFLQEKSWVDPAVLTQQDVSRLTLEHEQTHFDLAELHARKMRKAIAALTEPCRMTEEQRRAVVAPILDEDRNTQRRYDRETSNGRDLRWQTEWIRNVSIQLDALKQYAVGDSAMKWITLRGSGVYEPDEPTLVTS
jgi:Bacterial protein of unknown function (DUF922)